MEEEVPTNDSEGRIQLSKWEEALEIKSLRRIISAYLNYPDAAEKDVRKYERSFRKLPLSHKALLSHLPLKYERLRRCIHVNTHFIISMLQAFEPPMDLSKETPEEDYKLDRNHGDHKYFEIAHQHDQRHLHTDQGQSYVEDFSESLMSTSSMSCEMQENIGKLQKSEEMLSTETGCPEAMVNNVFRNTEVANDQTPENDVSADRETIRCYPCDWWNPSLKLNVPLVDVDKVRCIIRNIVRDWTLEGQKEREQCYKPILEELIRLFPTRSKERPPSCLVPGAGLGRLALEISCLGFVSEGNEFSYYMMICSNFILNHMQTVNEWTIHPWIHSNCNLLSDSDQLRAASFPDILPASAGITEGFCMCGGDFVEVYRDKSQEACWDAVVTCFFLDTAHNIVEYIEIISKVLKNGGVWINLGPLLYHFADTYDPDIEMSIELSLEDVKMVASQYGFKTEAENVIETTYTTNPRSMMQNRYYAAFWTMRKTVQD